MDHWGELRIVIRGMVGIIDRLLRSDNAARGPQRSYTILQFVIRACRSLTWSSAGPCALAILIIAPLTQRAVYKEGPPARRARGQRPL